MLMRKRFFLLLIVLCVSTFMHRGAAQAADPDNEEKARLEPFRDEVTGLEFTDVPGFQRDKVHHYDNPGLGYSIDYESKLGVRCTIYVFTGYKRQFLKIRCTLPADKQAECEKEFAEILARLESMLTKK